MDRKDFLSKLGFGAAALLAPACIGGLAACSKHPAFAPSNVDFTIDVSSGALAAAGGYLVQQGILIAHTNAGEFIAVSAACTHEGTNVNYVASGDYFSCPNHGAQFSSNGTITKGPAKKNLSSYKTELYGTTLRVYS